MPPVLCSCISYGCGNQTDYRPGTRETVKGQYLDPRIRRAHMRMDQSRGANTGQSTAEETIFQAACNATPELDPVVNSRAHLPQFPTTEHSPHITSTTDSDSSRTPTTALGLNQLYQYRSRFSDLLGSFQEPTSLEFERPEGPVSSVPTLKYTTESKGFLQHREIVTQLLVLVDGVDCAGADEVRKMRKDLVSDIENHLRHLDDIVSRVWKTQEYHDELQHLSGQVLTYDNRKQYLYLLIFTSLTTAFYRIQSLWHRQAL
jgi:hypothetical protein